MALGYFGVSLIWRLCDWALPERLCIVGDESDVCSGRRRIPVSMWQAALPAFRAVLAKAGDADERYQRLRELVRQPQRTKWILAGPDAYEWWQVYGESGKQSADVKQVEVLADIDWHYMGTSVLPSHHQVDVRCRLVLQPCPYLQNLDIIVDARAHVTPSHDDTFALLPRLRSLYLTQYENDELHEQATQTVCIDFEQMLDSLPHLTTLHCVDLCHLGISELLEIASHSSLEEVRVHGNQQQLADEEWIGKQIEFPISVEEDEIQLEQDDTRMAFDGDIEEESDVAALVTRVSSTSREQLADGADDEKEPAWVRDETKRLLAALTRTQPTQRSCEARLALADWLWRRLRRGRLRTDQQAQPKWLLRSRRKQVALVRTTLWQQLSELAETASTNEQMRQISRLRLVEAQLEECKAEHMDATVTLKRTRKWSEEFRLRAEEVDMFERSEAAVRVAREKTKIDVLQQKATVVELRISRLEEQRNALQASLQTSAEDVVMTTAEVSRKSAACALSSLQLDRPRKRARVEADEAACLQRC